MCFQRSALVTFLYGRNRVSQADVEDIKLFLRQTFTDELKVAEETLQTVRKNILLPLRIRWRNSDRKRKTFEKKNRSWLDVEECLPEPVCSTLVGRRGRPALPFVVKGRRAKQKATADLRRSASTPALVFSAAVAVRQDGRRRESRLLEEAGSPRRGSLLVARAAATPQPHASYTVDEALAMMVDLDLTTAQYNSMRLSAVERGCRLYPAYKKVTKAKIECLPPPGAITVLPDRAQVDLQPLLDHTAARLLRLQEPVLESLTDAAPLQLTLYCKWGLDGSSGHSQYKQAGVRQDDQMFVTTLVPLQLETERGTVIWRNVTPSSTRFCRPIHLQLAKETKDLTEQELQRVRSQIVALQSFRTRTAVIRYELTMSMVSVATKDIFFYN